MVLAIGTNCRYAFVGLPNRLSIYVPGSLGHLAVAFALLAVERRVAGTQDILRLLANIVLRASLPTKRRLTRAGFGSPHARSKIGNAK